MASRKLRDLYGSSILISHLARAQAKDAQGHGHSVVSPADIKVSRGVPNVLVIRGAYSKELARQALLTCWQRVLSSCRTWIEDFYRDKQPGQTFEWESSWRACGLHSWEVFHGQGATITAAREALAITKLQRAWSVPNWTGESSTLSSAEAVVRPEMGALKDPRYLAQKDIQEEARSFLRTLCESADLGIAFAGANEEISLTELVKRLITYPAVARTALATDSCEKLSHDELKALLPERFQRLTTMAAAEDAAAQKPESLVWFMVDGDGIGSHLESLAKQKGSEEVALKDFSADMRKWAGALYTKIPQSLPGHAMVVYAGGDDLFGALHESRPGRADLTTDHLWKWLGEFPKIWETCGQQDLTVSMGLVWADSQVPQREALQHAREAEASAKARGKNRFALRMLYANGNHLEWTCPWSWLNLIRTHYTDREGRTLHHSRDGKPPSWRHLAEDLQWLRSRQAIAVAASSKSTDAMDDHPCKATASALWDAYFPGCAEKLRTQAREGNELALKQQKEDAEEPPFRASFEIPEKGRRFDQWLWDLGRVMAGLEKHRSPAAAMGVRP